MGMSYTSCHLTADSSCFSEDEQCPSSPGAFFGPRKQDLPVRPSTHSSDEAEAEVRVLSLWRQ